MADDGIELNFAMPSAGTIRQVAAKKGGRWTDRVKAKRDARDTFKSLKAGPQAAVPTPPAAPAPVAKPTPAPAPKPAPIPKAAPPPRAAPPPKAAPAPTPAPARSAPPPKPQPQISGPTANASAGPSRPTPAPRVASVAAPKPAPKPAAKPRASLPVDTYLPPRLDTGAAAGPSRLPEKPKAPQFISSLFTSAPLPSAPKNAEAPAPVGAPSNAPVDTSTFAGLGLDKLLIRHLKSKMGVEKPTGIQRSCLPYMLSAPLDPNQKVDEEDDYETATAKAAGVKESSDEAALRDVLIQAQTGSGKTLAYLLPIVQTLLPLSRLSYIDRSIGTLAIILAPTRELAQQISKVLEQLLHLSLAQAQGSDSDDSEREDERPFTRWLVSGLLTGGSTRTHEKARLRKGVPILVSTPGRLLDHLQNTMSFQCAKTMFLVLDEADRLMDLGFEETIQGIIKALEGRRRNEINVEKEMDEEGGGAMRWPFWDRGRVNVLCSATVDAKVERLAGAALRNPVLFRSEKDQAEALTKEKEQKEKEKAAARALMTKEEAVAAAVQEAQAVVIPEASEDKFTPPSQLSQKYVVTPTKLKLVALVALLRSLVASAGKAAADGRGTKVIVFLSSTDAVDFHWKLLGGVKMGEEAAAEDEDMEGEEGAESSDEVDAEGNPKPSKPKPKAKKPKAAEDPISLTSALFPSTTLHRLHGSLPLRTRLASLSAFASPSPEPSILFATSVASRGLDLPLVRAVVQYDLPTEGGANEYVHRVGRTARAGKGGEAWAMVGPSEEKWVGWIEGKMGAAEGKGGVKLAQVGVEDVLRKGFGGKGWEYEGRATEVQLGFERWVLENETNAALARKAFASFIRAYSTHPLEVKQFFHIKSIHLGHLAKSFALREAPGALSSALSGPSTKKKTKQAFTGALPGGKRKREDGDDGEEEVVRGGKETTARNETERRMYEAVRKQGRTIKSGGKLGEFAGKNKGGKGASGGGGGGGGGEFHVVGTSELERMVSGKR
ncbi:hypothetical protein IAT38_005301 [Cryptococcus sp. DSM 104549]